MDDPMAIKPEHIENWRQRYDQLGSSKTRTGRRKTFELNPAGEFIVREHHSATVLRLYAGGDEAEAIRIYNEA